MADMEQTITSVSLDSRFHTLEENKMQNVLMEKTWKDKYLENFVSVQRWTMNVILDTLRLIQELASKMTNQNKSFEEA